MTIYDVYWKRGKPLPDVFQTQVIPNELRVQVHWLWKSTLRRFDTPSGNKYLRDIWAALCREKGKEYLFYEDASPEKDLTTALAKSNDIGLVLGIIEFSIRYVCVLKHKLFSPEEVDAAVDELNHRFREHGVGFQFDTQSGHLIPVNSTFTHEQAVRPALAVLAHPAFATANDEFMAAFDDFKKSDFDDCLTKCCSCFESVMKIVCAKKQWAFDPKATAAPLIQTIIAKTGMESFFEHPLMLIATMRNRLSSSHGAGTTPKTVPEHIARYALNATALAILLLVEATGV